MKVLYITYDGLTGPLGASQILPYLIGCARAGYEITIVSFEKESRRLQFGAETEALCKTQGLTWLPQRFRSSPPYLAKFLDHRTMAKAAFKAAAAQQFGVVHCRSYPAAWVGLRLKRRLGIKLIFDMRGFWPDQRREGGRWTDAHPLGRYLFHRWKRHEAELVAQSDHIVGLTDAAAAAIRSWPVYHGAPITIIPCCADFQVYRPSDPDARLAARKALGIPPGAPTLGYIGSIGTVYLLREQLRLFDAVRRRDGRARLLFIGHNSRQQILDEALLASVPLSEEDFTMVAAERDKIGYWISAADAGLCFCIPSFSSLGVSPTKLAEYLACGIPVIANRGVGDVGQILSSLKAGHVVPDFSNASIEAAADAFFRLVAVDRHAIRERARPLLDLPRAIASYTGLYDELSKLEGARS